MTIDSHDKFKYQSFYWMKKSVAQQKKLEVLCLGVILSAPGCGELPAFRLDMNLHSYSCIFFPPEGTRLSKPQPSSWFTKQEPAPRGALWFQRACASVSAPGLRTQATPRDPSPSFFLAAFVPAPLRRRRSGRWSGPVRAVVHPFQVRVLDLLGTGREDWILVSPREWRAEERRKGWWSRARVGSRVGSGPWSSVPRGPFAKWDQPCPAGPEGGLRYVRTQPRKPGGPRCRYHRPLGLRVWGAGKGHPSSIPPPSPPGQPVVDRCPGIWCCSRAMGRPLTPQ